MRILILGGTGFLGRALMEVCVARGHSVTLFHRGLSQPERFAHVEHILGDRELGLEALGGRAWDVIFDSSGYEVRHVREAAKLAAELYVFVSTISVYRDVADMHESGPVHELADAANVELSLATYGGLKAACERAVDAELPGRALHVRAGLIVGPHDYDRRFRWWLQRIAQGGEVLAPGDPEAFAQAIDVRDLADWMVTSAERRLTGAFNAAGEPHTMRTLLETLRAATGSDAEFSWVPDSILQQQEVAPYSDMPFWLPASLGARPVDISRARAAGLSLRPLLQTAQDTWTWLQTSWDDEDCVRAHRKLSVPAGITPEREQELLNASRRAAEPS